MPPPTVGGGGVVLSSRPSGCPSIFHLSSPSTSVLHDAVSVYRVKEFQWSLTQLFITWVGIAEKVFMVRSQRSRSCAKCVDAIMMDEYISTMWHRGFHVWNSLSVNY